MNTKDRDEKIKKKITRKVKNKSEKYIKEIFSLNDEENAIVSDFVNSSSNILFISPALCDNSIITSYILSHFSDKKSFCLVEDILDKNSFINIKRKVLINSDIHLFVKVIEYIVSGIDGFIVGFDLKSYKNVLDNIITLILINFPNLSCSQLANLLSLSDFTVFYIEKDEDGLFVVKSVDKIVLTDEGLSLKNMYLKETVGTVMTKEPEDIYLNSEIGTDSMDVEVSVASAEEISLLNSKINILEDEEKVINQSETDLNDVIVSEEVNPPKKEKINKYRLLKDKVKKHKEELLNEEIIQISEKSQIENI